MDGDRLVANLLQDLMEVHSSFDRLAEDDGLVVLQLLQETVKGFDLVGLWDFAVELLQTVKGKLFLVIDQNFLWLVIVGGLLFA